MIGVLFQRNMRQMMLPFVVILSVLIMYGGIIIYMYDPALINMLNDFQNLMPEMMQAFGMMGATNSLLAFCGTYLYGFLMLLFPLVFIVMMGNSYVMKYVDKGSLTVLLTSKNSRKKVIVTQAFSLLFATTILLLITTLSFIGIAVLLFPGELEITKFIILNVNLWLVQLVVAGIVFLAACIANENKYFYSIAVGIPLFFFLTNMLANMGNKLAGFRFLSLYTLFPIETITAGELAIIYLLILGIMVVALFGIGSAYFIKKDFSI